MSYSHAFQLQLLSHRADHPHKMGLFDPAYWVLSPLSDKLLTTTTILVGMEQILWGECRRYLKAKRRRATQLATLLRSLQGTLPYRELFIPPSQNSGTWQTYIIRLTINVGRFISGSLHLFPVQFILSFMLATQFFVLVLVTFYERVFVIILELYVHSFIFQLITFLTFSCQIPRVYVSCSKIKNSGVVFINSPILLINCSYLLKLSCSIYNFFRLVITQLLSSLIQFNFYPVLRVCQCNVQ